MSEQNGGKSAMSRQDVINHLLSAKEACVLIICEHERNLASSAISHIDKALGYLEAKPESKP